MRHGKAWRWADPLGIVQRLGDWVGSAALPTFDFAFLLALRPLQSWHEVLEFF